MRKQHLAIPLAAGLAMALAPGARAATFYIPNPEIGGSGRPTTKLEVSKTGPRKLAPVFIETGHPGTGLDGDPVGVDNDEKPNVFNVSPFIDGTGMLRLDGDGGIEVRTGVLFLERGNDTLTWAMPVLSEANWYQPGETAFLQNLSRSASGHANIEIMNFAPAAAVCQVTLLRPKGSPLAPAETVALLPVSHRIVEDPFDAVLSVPSAAGLRAQVTCNQPFYAYGTFVGADARTFRMLYALDGPPVAPVETVSLDRPGVFFAPAPGRSALDLALPLVPGRGYRAATIDFDVRISKFTTHFTGLLGMFHTGGARFNKTLYFGSFVRGLRSRTLVDQGSAVVEPALKFGTGWKEGATHHVKIVYDTESAIVRMQVTRNDAVIADVTGSAFNLDLADRGNPVRLAFGLPGVADGAYWPPNGWKFSNLQVRVTR
jgi:hypothetical protein